MTRVAVSGALGRMGSLARRAIEAAPDLEYVGGFGRTRKPEERIEDDLERLLLEQRPEVLVDFTMRPMSQEAARLSVEHGVSPVIGSSEWTDGERAELERLCSQRGVGALFVPNFALGAVLMMSFAREAASYFPSAEIVEMHRAEKRDKPSGTALATAREIASGGGPADVPIHSVRLQGLLSHQAVLFGNTGELLTIRHDSFSSDSFAQGIALAARRVRSLDGYREGLETLL